MSVSKERWFQIVDTLSRPAGRWLFILIAAGYGARPVFNLSFDTAWFAALCVPALGTYGARGLEKLRAKEEEQ